MRVAVIADIHGNAPALAAVADDLRAAAPDLVVNLGDALSGPLWAGETADRLVAEAWPTVRGNHDRQLVDRPRDAMGSWEKDADEELTDVHRAWLRALPLTLRLDDLLLFHARPDQDDAYLMERVTEAGDAVAAAPADVEARLRGARAPLILCGHTHVPRLLRLGPDCLVLNPGSVGCPGFEDSAPVRHRVEAGAPHARYALATRRAGVWSVDFRAVPYDWDRAAARAAERGRAMWARVLATGFVG